MAHPATMMPTPQCERENGSRASATWRCRGEAPSRDTTVNGEVKNQRIQPDQKQQKQFDAECQVTVRFGRLRGTPEKSAQEHNREANPRERQNLTSQLRDQLTFQYQV